MVEFLTHYFTAWLIVVGYQSCPCYDLHACLANKQKICSLAVVPASRPVVAAAANYRTPRCNEGYGQNISNPATAPEQRRDLRETGPPSAYSVSASRATGDRYGVRSQSLPRPPPAHS